MTNTTIYPKEGDWVLIKDGIKRAFDAGYEGAWTSGHHKLLERIVQVHDITHHPLISYIVTVPHPKNILSYLEFPSTCIEIVEVDVPKGWCPAVVPPSVDVMTRCYNIFLGVIKNPPINIPLLVSWIDDKWIQYSATRTIKVPASITAYQTLPNWPIKKPSKEKHE